MKGSNWEQSKKNNRKTFLKNIKKQWCDYIKRVLDKRLNNFKYEMNTPLPTVGLNGLMRDPGEQP